MIGLSLLYFNLTSAEYQLHQVCRGTKRVTDVEGNEVQRAEGAVFGIAVSRFDTLLGDGAYVHMLMLGDITDLGFGSRTIKNLIIDKDKEPESIWESIYLIQFEDNNQYEKVSVIISNNTKTLHYSSSYGDFITNFDGHCRDVEFFDPTR